MNKIKILIVEDEQLMALDLKEKLEDMGFTVTGITDSGEQTLKEVAETLPDLVLMDIVLEGNIDGIETAKRIRQKYKLPVIYLTAFTDEETMHRAKLSEPFAYLVKPYNEWELKFIIEIATYKHKLEKDLKKSEKSYRTLAENLPGIVYRVHIRENYRIEFFNDMIRELTGCSSEDLKPGKICSFEPLIIPEDKDKVIAELKKAVKEARAFEIDYRIEHKDGTIRYFRERGKPVPGEDNKPIYIDGVIFDITERKRAAVLTRKQLDLAQALSATLDIDEVLAICVQTAIDISGMDAGGIYLLDQESGALELVYSQGLSSGFVKKASYYDAGSPNTRLVMEGRPIYRHYDDILPEIKEKVRLQEGLHTTAIIPVLHDNKVIACLNITSHSLDKITDANRYALETIAAQIGVVIARMQANQALLKEKDRTQSYLDVAGVIIVVINADQRVELINRKGCEILGYSEEEIIGKNWFDHFLPQEEIDEVKNVFNRLIKGEVEPVEYFENPVLSKSGYERLIAWHNALLRDEKGNIIGTISSGLDVSERKKMEDEMQKAEKLESLGLLAGGIAHDFNNTLSAILINISLAKMYIENKQRAVDRLNEAGKAVNRAQNLTQQLLTFSKGGAPIKHLAPIAALLKDTADFALSGSRARVEFSIPEDLHDVNIDRGQVSQVIQNIIMNAAQAMPEGGVIRIRAANETIKEGEQQPLKEGKYIKIAIEDSGIGILPDHLDKIFDPFFTTKQKGSGLGLSTAYSIIRNHNGLITVESEIGRGTTFYIYLPSSGKKAEKIEKKEQKPAAAQGKILLMDDEEMILEATSQLLQKTGYTVETALDGEKAVKLYKKARKSGQPFAAVILDLIVPGAMGGKEAMRKLLKIDPGVKALVSSGYSTDAIMANYHEYGFAAAISKPYKPDTLLALLQQALAGAEPGD